MYCYKGDELELNCLNVRVRGTEQPHAILQLQKSVLENLADAVQFRMVAGTQYPDIEAVQLQLVLFVAVHCSITSDSYMSSYDFPKLNDSFRNTLYNVMGAPKQ